MTREEFLQHCPLPITVWRHDQSGFTRLIDVADWSYLFDDPISRRPRLLPWNVSERVYIRPTGTSWDAGPIRVIFEV
jgi:hypothetical protein